MSGGFAQLLIRGAEDAFLTGTPEVTFFASVYAR